MPKPADKDLIKLAKVPAILKELTGVTRSRITVYNWAKYGRIGAHGQRVKLSTYRRMRQYYTTEEAVIKFLRELG